MSSHPLPGTAEPRIYSKARFAWIHPEPRSSKAWLGYLGLGGSVPLRGRTVSAARVEGGRGCRAWYAVEPRGYVCPGDTATLDPKDPVVLELAADAPNVNVPWPYSYGESTGTPRYAALPSPDEQRHNEWDLEAHLAHVARARAGEPRDPSLDGIDIEPAHVDPPGWTPLSPFVREARKQVAYAIHDCVHAILRSPRSDIPRNPRPCPDSQGPCSALSAIGVPWRRSRRGSDASLAFFREHERPKFPQGARGQLRNVG